MAYKIGGDCISCGTCEGDCQYVIDAGACIDCGNCAANCPVGAISQA